MLTEAEKGNNNLDDILNGEYNKRLERPADKKVPRILVKSRE